MRDTVLAQAYANAVVQAADGGRSILVRLPPHSNVRPDASARIVAILRHAAILRVDVVGPSFGDEMRESGGLAMRCATGGIVAYLAQRRERSTPQRSNRLSLRKGA